MHKNSLKLNMKLEFYVQIWNNPSNQWYGNLYPHDRWADKPKLEHPISTGNRRKQ